MLKTERFAGGIENWQCDPNGSGYCDETNPARNDEEANGSSNEREGRNRKEQTAWSWEITDEKEGWRWGGTLKKTINSGWRFMKNG